MKTSQHLPCKVFIHQDSDGYCAFIGRNGFTIVSPPKPTKAEALHSAIESAERFSFVDGLFPSDEPRSGQDHLSQSSVNTHLSKKRAMEKPPESNEWNIPAGSIVKIGDFPYTTLHDVTVSGFSDPRHELTKQTTFTKDDDSNP